jgi:DNA-binding LacI/PurR family transcriptional regulator
VVTSRDVARVAGVSQSTVSYVMSGRRSISAETRKRVLDAIEQLTYQPNAGARALASQRTQVIGLVVPFGPGADTAGLLPFIETIASCARAEDHDVLLVTTDEGAAGLTRLAGRALCDAIVLMDIEADDARIPVAAALKVPVSSSASRTTARACTASTWTSRWPAPSPSTRSLPSGTTASCSSGTRPT